ncbi:MAG: lysophospholipid acyltransferase family protein [Pirellulaceae bacterium]|nr:lysophospholipid acyltransferase family protein [Pirellulaceae bacterium]
MKKATKTGASRRRIAVDYTVYLFVRIVVCIIQMVPMSTCHRASSFLADLFSRRLGLRKKLTLENLRGAFPNRSESFYEAMSFAMWEHLFLMLFEIAHIPRKIHETNWRDSVTLKNKRGFLAPLLTDRPSLYVSGHFGNFEVAGYVAGLFGVPTFSVARPLDNPFLNRFLNEFRGKKGQYMLPKQKSAPIIQYLLDRGGNLALLGDQHAGDKGCWVDFFGREASCHKGLALFSLSNHAVMSIFYVTRMGKAMKFEFGLNGSYDLFNPTEDQKELGSVRQLTVWYNRRLEEAILKAPEQYWWLHRRWREKPVRQKRKRVAPAQTTPPSEAA